MKLLLTAFCLLLALGPAWAQPDAPAPACHGCAFSDAIDQRIRLCQRLAANGDSCEPYHLRRLIPVQPGVPPLADDALASFTTSKAVRWSAWSDHLEWLSWYLPMSNATKPLAGTDGQYERLSDASGRQLFLAGDGPNEPGLLLEFQGPRFRLIMLNYGIRGSSTCHRYRYPDADLLVFMNTDGIMSKIFNAATTWLSIFDLRTNTWLLDTVVETDNDDSYYASTQRRYQVKDAGRTVTLGSYRYSKNHYQTPTSPEKDEPRSNHDLPPGTYHLRAGRYQRATAAALLAATRPGPAPAPRRPAIPAAEVNGTFRDARGREFALLALGGGKLRVGFRDAGTKTAGGSQAHRFTHDARIAADSAVLQLPPSAGCPAACGLRLHFERPGTLQVRKARASCTAAAVGTYLKISDAKPAFN